MEIKTCEQYVVDRLQQTENENLKLKAIIADRDCQIDDLQTVLDDFKTIVRKIATFRDSIEGKPLISFDTVWEEYDKEEFKYLKEILGLTKEGDEE